MRSTIARVMKTNSPTTKVGKTLKNREHLGQKWRGGGTLIRLFSSKTDFVLTL
jgi:hypothetical protein